MTRLLWDEIEEWSNATFGNETERGPVGALTHLSREALEAAAHPSDETEYADCLILLMDATRRSCTSWDEVVMAALRKMAVNRTRYYPKPEPGNDEVVEHDRTRDPVKP